MTIFSKEEFEIGINIMCFSYRFENEEKNATSLVVRLHGCFLQS